MKKIAQIAVFMMAAAMAAGAAKAQTFPRKPIRMVVPFQAGGPTDVLARVIAQKMGENWNQPVIVDNRPGANTIIGAEIVAKAPADGYTILMAIDSTLVMNQYLYAKLPYDPLKDFAPISITAWSPLIIAVDAATGPKSVQELVQLAKSNPGKISYASATFTTQLGAELFKKMAKVDMLYVPYKGSSGNLQALLAKDVSIVVDGVTPYVPHIKNGRLRVLATTGTRTIAALPDTPKLADMPGFSGFDVAVWLGLVAPAGTPADVVNKLHQEVVRILALPDVKEKLAEAGIDSGSSASPAEFSAFIAREAVRWSTVVKETGIQVN
jgi:tripartite-type tricarboxylate transporter receptor subunit TctC